MNGPQITAIGRLTTDPKLQYSTNRGTPFVPVTIAVHTAVGPNNDTETTFFETTFWNRNAHTVANYCRRGHPVLFQGAYRFHTFTRRDGSEGYSHRVSASDVTLLQTGNQSSQETSPETGQSQTQPDAFDPDPEEGPITNNPAGQENPL